MKIDRRNFLRLFGLALGSTLAKPPADIDWPEGVVTRFDLETPYYALTIDDGFHAENILPFVRFCNQNFMRATWFANGRGIVAAGDFPEIADRMVNDGWTVGYHTMHHPAIDDQLQNYNRQRWLDDYDEWYELAMKTFPDNGPTKSIVRPYARAAGGLFSVPFMQMCEERGLTPTAWSKDPMWINAHPDDDLVEPGDIFLTHFRSSEWPWFEQLSRLEMDRGMTSETIDTVYRQSRIEAGVECSTDERPPCIFRVNKQVQLIAGEMNNLFLWGDL
jgi:hypothetical protein